MNLLIPRSRRHLITLAVIAFMIWWCTQNPHLAAQRGHAIMHGMSYAVGQLGVFVRKAT